MRTKQNYLLENKIRRMVREAIAEMVNEDNEEEYPRITSLEADSMLARDEERRRKEKARKDAENLQHVSPWGRAKYQKADRKYGKRYPYPNILSQSDDYYPWDEYSEEFQEKWNPKG